MTVPVPPTTTGAVPGLMSLQGEGAHRCSFPFAGNVPDPRTNDAMAGLLTCRSALFGRLPGDSSSGLWASSSRLTVAGTASEFHRVPSWPPHGSTICLHCGEMLKHVSTRRSPIALTIKRALRVRVRTTRSSVVGEERAMDGQKRRAPDSPPAMDGGGRLSSNGLYAHAPAPPTTGLTNQKSMPRTALIPASKGCLTGRISADKISVFANVRLGIAPRENDAGARGPGLQAPRSRPLRRDSRTATRC